MNNRATLDPEVIAEWARRCAKSRKASRAPGYILITLFLAAASLPLLGVVAYFPYLVYVGVIAAFAATMFPGAAFASLRCPHCNKTLIPVGQIPLTPDRFLSALLVLAHRSTRSHQRLTTRPSGRAYRAPLNSSVRQHIIHTNSGGES
jgi:hypothetical protein